MRWLLSSLWLAAGCTGASPDDPAEAGLPRPAEVAKPADAVWFANPPAAVDDPRASACTGPACVPGDTVSVEYQTTRACTVRYSIKHRELGRTLFQERYAADAGQGQLQFLVDLPKDAPVGPGYTFEVALLDGNNRVFARKTAPFELKAPQLARNASR